MLVTSQVAPPEANSGPLFDRVEAVLRGCAAYRAFRDGRLARGDFARFLDEQAPALIAAGVPAADVEFAKRFPASERGFVESALTDLVARGVVPSCESDPAGFDRIRVEPFDHGGRTTYIYPEEARLLHALAAIVRPKRAVFLGSYYGYWARWAIPAIVGDGGHAILVDPDEESQGIARRNLSRPPFGHGVEFATQRGEVYLEAGTDTFDLVVIDAECPRDDPDPDRRGKRIYRRLFEAVLPRLAPGALVVCHNILMGDHSGSAFFHDVITRNRQELGPFLSLAASALESFAEYPSTEGVGVGVARR